MPIPVEALLPLSKMSVQDFRLLKLAAASRYWKAGQELTRQGNEAWAEALFAGWLVKNREALLELGRTEALQETLDFPDILPTEAMARESAAKSGVVKPAN